MRFTTSNLENELLLFVTDLETGISHLRDEYDFKSEVLICLGNLVSSISNLNKLYYETYSERFPLYISVVRELTDIETEIEEINTYDTRIRAPYFEKRLSSLADECRDFYFPSPPENKGNAPAPKTKISPEEINELREYIGGFTGNDDNNPGNKSILEIPTSKLESLDEALQIVSISQEIPNWSEKTIRHIKGAKAVLVELWPIFRPFAHRIAKTWNKVLKGLAIQIKDIESEN